MPGFADSFWSSDHAAGLGVLFGKLQQGVAENQQILTIARMRAEIEDLYGQRLSEIGPATDKISGGFSRDDGASIKKAYDGVRFEMEEASRNHRKIAASIRELVLNPFARWCDGHEGRVQGSQDELQARIKLHDKQAELVSKLRTHYFNKCRLVEDIEEENKLGFQEPAIVDTAPKTALPIPEIKVQDKDEEDEHEPIEIGDEIYHPDQVKKMLSHMLQNIKLGETKVPILGTYLNTTAGTDIVEYAQKNMGATSVSHAERIGQDLVSHGFLRLVGNVGSTFANSSKMFYQWRPKAFKVSGVPEKKQPLSRSFSLGANSEFGESPVVGTVTDMLAGWNIVNQHPNETPAQRLRREASEADQRYKSSVRKLDQLRCQLEEAMFEHLRFMERCELDRLKAIKAVILDFSGAISNVIPSLQSTVDKMMLYQETVQPLGDLRYLLENYRTGGFAPKVQVYDNYYISGDGQTFGVDLDARARGDKKKVPNVVTSILNFLDDHYPDMEGDEARRGIWLVDVPLTVTHRLRNEINTGQPVPSETLARYEIPIVASVLKLYFLELPDSLVSYHVYDIVKSIYSTSASESTDSARIAVLRNTLIQLRLPNITTLYAVVKHFTRLIELTSADEAYVHALATVLAPCILRPRLENALTMEEKHSYRLIRDLFTHRDAIFEELKEEIKRASSLTHGANINQNRPRAVSTDESNRKAHMEERTRAILASSGPRSRATSPAPGARGHRRDRSTGGPETRFPIQVSSPTSPGDSRSSRNVIGNSHSRNSLEVPGSLEASPVADPHELHLPIHGYDEHNGHLISSTDGIQEDVGVEKRNSLGRSAHVGRMTARKHIGNAPVRYGLGQGEPSDPKPVGVSLTDAPMDD